MSYHSKKIKQPQKVIKLEKLLEKLEILCEKVESVKQKIIKLEVDMNDSDIKEAEYLFRCKQMRKYLYEEG